MFGALDRATEAVFRSGMALVVRPVVAADVPRVEALLRAVLEEFGLVFGEGSATDAQVLELPTSYTGHGGGFWVAEVDGDLRGTCGVFPVAPGVPARS